jgi:phenylalanyl-tRNA synthetase alpha chain
MIDFTPIDRISWTLTEEGKQVAKEGSHEARVFEAIPAGEEGLPIAELQVYKYIHISNFDFN